MKEETKQLIWDLTKIGLIGTAISIPIGVLLVPPFRRSPWVPALALTLTGFLIKEMMLSEREHM